MSSPSGQGPCPDAVLMCPALAMMDKSDPQALANCWARSMLQWGSLELAIIRLGNGSVCMGVGAKPPCVAGQPSIVSGSAGATMKAPAM